MKTLARVPVLVLVLLMLVAGIPTTAAPPPLTQAQLGELGGAQLIEAAQREGGVVVYTAVTGNEAEYLAKRFMEQFPGIRVELVRRGGGELYELIAAEVTAGRFRGDVIEQSSPALLTRLQTLFLVLEPYTSPSDAKYNNPYVVSRLFHTPWLILHGFAYNTALVRGGDIPTRWRDLLNPAFDGRRSVVSATGGGCAEALWFVLDKQVGQGYWREMAARKPIITSSNGLMIQMLARGEVVVTTMLDVAARPQIKQGAPVTMVYPRDGVAPCVNVTGVTKKAPHPNAGRLWLNWTLSELGQTVWVKELGLFSLRQGMPDPPGINRRDLNIIWFDPRPLASNRDAFVKRWTEVFNYTP